jgi:hypothetical protein
VKNADCCRIAAVVVEFGRIMQHQNRRITTTYYRLAYFYSATLAWFYSALDTRVIRISNADHYVHRSNEAQVIDEMKKFLSNLP